MDILYKIWYASLFCLSFSFLNNSLVLPYSVHHQLNWVEMEETV